jgi:hypothetical protein
MTDAERKATRAFIEEYTAAHTQTRKAALKAMIKEDIYTPAGYLRPEFGGPVSVVKKRKGKKAA